MLAYCKDPMGYIILGDKRIYGECFAYGSFGARNITRLDFKRNRHLLVEAPITDKILSAAFKRPFPPMVFKCTELNKLTYGELLKIHTALFPNYSGIRKKEFTGKIPELRKLIIQKMDDTKL